MDAAKTDGFWAQRSLDLTYIPSALYFNGIGWQLSFNVIDVLPGQIISVNYGQTEAGWLLETRIHQRKDLNRLNTAVRNRVETDMYLRYSISF